MSNTRPAPTSVRLDPDIAERLDAFCREHRRTRNNAVNFLLDRALELAEHPADVLEIR